MRATLAFIGILMLSPVVQAQIFAVDTLLKNGPVSDRINLVFMGDGYTLTEQEKFITDVNEILEAMFSKPPFKTYRNYFNAFAVKVISAESGASHPKTTTDSDCTTPIANVDNYFGSTFDFQGIHRLLYPTKFSKVIDVLAANFPLYDQAFVAVNSPYYGGAGGFVATCSDHANGRDVAIHEIGHSFAGLADEYWAGPTFASEKPNMTRQTDPALVKWKNWIGVSGVGIYPHAGDAAWKKPHTGCKMEKLNVPFCKVCSETFVERFHGFVKPVSGFFPTDARFQIDPELEQNLDFSVSLVVPDPNTLKIVWEMDAVRVADNIPSIMVPSGSFQASTLIRATIKDTTDLTRSEYHDINHVYIIEWEVTKSNVVTGMEIVTDARKYELSVYPNPAEDDLSFSYTLSKPGKVDISIVNSNGQRMVTLVKATQSPGVYKYEIDREKLKISPAMYTVQFNFGKTTIPVKVMLR